MGEPLLHPNFNDYISRCEKAGITVHLVTNGALISDDNISALLNPTVREINFSLQSFAGSYGEDADDTDYLQGIFSFIEHAQELRPDIYINLRLWNLDGYEDARTSNYKMLQKIYNHFGKPVPEFKIGKKIHGRSIPITGVAYVNFSTRFAWPSMQLPEMRTTGYCMGLMTQLGIHNDGTVVPCCLDDNAEINLGNINESSLAEILDGSRSKAMFKGFEKETLTEALCRRCAFGARFKKRVRVRG
jgi:radical SAM protein with 4Fe4S-binding SPASM domain